MLMQEIVNALVQLTVVLIIALIFWAIFGRKKAGYFSYIGLIAPTWRSMRTALLLFIVVGGASAAIYAIPELREGASAKNTIAGALREQGFSLEIVAVILVMAGIKTALSEEIFFRGLFAKRLINWLGFWAGNTLHALIFGAIHLLIFVVPGGPEFSLKLGAAFFLLPAAAGWVMAYANEKAGNGSIAPSWLMHALGNAIAYPILAFLV